MWMDEVKLSCRGSVDGFSHRLTDVDYVWTQLNDGKISFVYVYLSNPRQAGMKVLALMRFDNLF
jgi:hypothetical protein